MFKNHPKGLIPAALSNMGERFGYYIMNAVLLLFLCSKFGLDEGTSGAIYSVFYAGIYVLSLVGGFIADRTQNYKGTIQWGLLSRRFHCRPHSELQGYHPVGSCYHGYWLCAAFYPCCPFGRQPHVAARVHLRGIVPDCLR